MAFFWYYIILRFKHYKNFQKDNIEDDEIDFTLDSNSIRTSVSLGGIVVLLTKNRESIHYNLSTLIKRYPEIFGKTLNDQNL